MAYRIFIGSWDSGEPDWVHHDYHVPTFSDARERMLEHLMQYADDDCEACRADAIGGIRALEATKPGRFEWMVDGDDYLILEE